MVAAVFWCLAAVALVAQPPALRVELAADRSLAFSVDDLRSLPRSRATVDRQGGMATYEGVRLVELLRRAGLDVGRAALQGDLVTGVLVAGGSRDPPAPRCETHGTSNRSVPDVCGDRERALSRHR